MKIELTTDWPLERLAGYGPQITAAMRKLVERFPTELTVKSLMGDLMSGKAQLWLIMDDDDGFIAFVMTEIRMNEATGHRHVVLSELAGGGGVDVVPMIQPIERWAREQGITDIRPVGREGWKRALKKMGYRVDICLFRKEL
jgi:hypothetical protein